MSLPDETVVRFPILVFHPRLVELLANSARCELLASQVQCAGMLLGWLAMKAAPTSFGFRQQSCPHAAQQKTGIATHLVMMELEDPYDFRIL
jgi:hypothetical protein